MQEIVKKLMSKVTKSKVSDCWEWSGYLNRYGYPHCGEYLAHRLSYLAHIGPIPEGLCVCHRCDNRRCINPDHLFIGTKTDNAIDRDKKQRGTIANGDNRLTPGMVSIVKDLLSMRFTNTRIGKIFNVKPCRISSIKTGRSFKYVERANIIKGDDTMDEIMKIAENVIECARVMNTQ